jgi:hypothetical protein
MLVDNSALHIGGTCKATAAGHPILQRFFVCILNDWNDGRLWSVDNVIK